MGYRFYTFLCIVIFHVAAIGQNMPIDFESGGHGASWTWTVFENQTNPPLSIVANPDQSGANCTNMVAEFHALSGGNPWAGCETLHGGGTDTFEIRASNRLINILVYKPVLSDVGIKIVRTDNWALPEKKISNTLTNTWELITFDFADHIGVLPPGFKFDQIVVFPDFDLGGRGQNNLCYFDHIWGDPSVADIGCPLPVELASFFARYDDGQVNLTWTTHVEENNDFFNVLKSADGYNYDTIGTVKGRGNSSSEYTYNFVDPNPLSGLNYYRLEQVDFDGTSTLTYVVSASANTVDFIDVIPNPTLDTWRIFSKEAIVQVNVYDITGQLLSNTIEESTLIELEASHLAPGVYIAEVRTKAGKIIKKRMIKR